MNQPAVGSPTVISTALQGGFISEPSAFPNAPDGLAHVMKLMYRPSVRANGDLSLDVSTDAFVVDISAIDPALFDARKLVADCDFLKRIASAHEEELRQIIASLQKGTAEGAENAEQIAKEIGATEDDAVTAGGGLLFLAIGVAVLVGGCVGAGAKHKVTSSAHTTTPKQPQ